jgi:hypothetical protein
VACPPLTVHQILDWADNYRARTGTWPKTSTGAVDGGPDGENWRRLDNALRLGLRGLPGGSSLARLLAACRGVRNIKDLPPLTEARIGAWARDHRRRTGAWPTRNSGPVLGAAGEVWANLDTTLREGGRGLPGGSCLARLLAERCGVRNRLGLPPLSVEQILAWADRYHRRTGGWPRASSGPIPEVPGETWRAVDAALRGGRRGLRGSSSLARLLARERGVRNRRQLPRLTRRQILTWADAHRRRTGKWPTCASGPIPEAPGETWKAVGTALVQGLRGLRGGSSLAKLLARAGRKRNRARLPRLTVGQILDWADRHRRRTGAWPTYHSGNIAGTEETWAAVDRALRLGRRGLPGGDSLAELLRRRRGVTRRAAPAHS